ncbi:MAG: proton-translocating nicotinamide nucleotide transhydrogenase subunit PntB [Bacteriovoracaceae bacterium]|nr:proton-translocating nicotinamide nucleotide transhydrogenase subunit PntB [Bacteriovoracaceae bacterium]
MLSPDFFAAIYLLATILFIFGLKGLSSPKTALTGNRAAMFGMLIAVVATLFNPEVKSYSWIFYGLVGGALIGSITAMKIQMTAMPQLVAALHSFVGLSATLVAIGTYFTHEQEHALNSILCVELGLGAAIGAVTFTGSVVAFGKLQELITSNPLVFKGQHFLNLLIGVGIIGLTIHFVMAPAFIWLALLSGLSLLIGFLLVLPIGGADMPVIVSMLNSYSGWAASATGFTLHNNLLIATGALVGSSGAILSYIMCKAMNRSFISVILGGFGGEAAAAAPKSAQGKTVKSAAPEDVAFVLENSSKVIIVPGYGMAVAQAQHAVKELVQALQAKGIEVKFAIHPVAGRMPGHMNVLLAEAEIPYDIVFEMDEINGEFSTTDVALVLGANDVVNPAAKSDKSSPLYGMPILDVYKAKQIFVSKRSMKAGYAGVDNELFYYDNCSLVFGDAKATIEAIHHALSKD